MAYRARRDSTRKLAATIMVGLLVAIVVLAAGQFLGWFHATKTVTLFAPRAGLVMNPDAKVKLRGVTVGHVKRVRDVGDRAELVLDIDADQIGSIPANVTVDIKSNTVFGAKAVNFVIPAEGPRGALAAGDRIDSAQVVVELNTVYQKLVNLLAKTEPEKLNVVLGAVQSALDGRGEQIGDALVELNEILGKTNRTLPELNDLFEQAAGATRVYADAMPQLMRTVDNATAVGTTLVEQGGDLDRLLIDVTGMARAGDGVLSASRKDLMATLSDLNPVLDLLGYQSPGLRCFITAAGNAADIAEPLLGGRNGMLLLDAGLIPGQDPYRWPQDLPEVRGDGPPTCQAGLSDITSTEKIPFYVIDNAEQPYQPRTTPKVQAGKLFNLLFGGTPRG